MRSMQTLFVLFGVIACATLSQATGSRLPAAFAEVAPEGSNHLRTLLQMSGGVNAGSYQQNGGVACNGQGSSCTGTNYDQRTTNTGPTQYGGTQNNPQNQQNCYGSNCGQNNGANGVVNQG